MTDILSQVKEGYKSLGYANDWPIRNGAVTKPDELVKCAQLGHKIKSTSTKYGHHHFYCDQCEIQYWMDSGD